MYHGIVTGCFAVTKIERKERLHRLTVNLNADLVRDLIVGASVSLDGVCLTVSEVKGSQVSFDVMGETLECTTLGSLMENDLVNIERSARANDEIGGHLLSGHIDGKAKIIGIATPPNNYIITCWVGDDLIKDIFRKGYVALNGASLTVAEVDRKNNWFRVCLIPETLKLTTFATKKIGDFLNLEIERNTQVIVDTVHELFAQTVSEGLVVR
jgi:riboflavin synthase